MSVCLARSFLVLSAQIHVQASELNSYISLHSVNHQNYVRG